jgi:ribonuclease BN (tRNA processing enzyme)
MIITTLGTSHGNPTYCRFNSSTLIETAGRMYLVDAGEPVTALLVRAGKNFDLLKAVFVTHMHGDHVGGLSSLIKMLVKYPQRDKHARVFLPEARAVPALEGWLKAQHMVWPSAMVALDFTLEGITYQDGLVKVEAIPTMHMQRHDESPSYSYLFELEGRRIVITGDLKGDFSDFPIKALDAPCDICICEATHYDLDSALQILVNAPIRKLILTHIGDKWHDEGESRLRTWLNSLPYPSEIASDGAAFVL